MVYNKSKRYFYTWKINLFKFLKKRISRFYKVIFLIWSIELIYLTYFFNFLDELFFLKIFSVLSFIISLIILKFNYFKIIAFSKILLILFWILYGWDELVNFLYNYMMFLQSNELYIDSPATIIIVFIQAFLSLFFPILLSISLCCYPVQPSCAKKA